MSEGLAIARARIAEEKEKRTGFLDLGMLGLEDFPEELWELQHLTGLNWGSGWRDERGKWRKASAQVKKNAVPATLGTDAAWLSNHRLPELLQLSLSETQCSELGFLAAFPALQSLSCISTQVSSLEPLAALTSLQWINCGGTQVSSLEPLAALTSLQTLHCSSTQVSSLEPLAALTSLQTLSCSSAQVSSLEPLAALTSLHSLSCSYTKVSNLEPLAALTSLQTLSCSSTQVSSLEPLAALTSLHSLSCYSTQVSRLEPLAALTSLRSLNCSDTQVSRLEPLAALTSLQSLECSSTQVSSLEPLAALTSLRSLYCYNTQVSSLEPLAALTSLRSLNCSRTQVSSLEPLAALTSLRSLNCSRTQVSRLEPLAALTSLQSLDCFETNISELPLAVVWNENLTRLEARGENLRQYPKEVLSENRFDDCLDRLRAHLRDLEAGEALLPDVKVMVLGNGRIGKTQICNRLRGQPFEQEADSTHGITVTTTPLGAEAQLRLWDFGGQDIYHGTHALFMRSRALFLLVWTPAAEDSQTHEHGGMTFRNHPLAYWLAYVKHLAGKGSPLLVIQNQCDEPEDERLRPPVDDAVLGAFKFRKQLHFSALNDRGRPALDDSLKQAIDWLRKEQGQAKIGIGRLAVKNHIDALRNADAEQTDPNQRKHRTITQEHFRAICDECGNVSDPALLLDYLHQSGVVFYQRGLFDELIILDQAWALDAVYAVFNRKSCYAQLRQMKGCFTRPLLEALVWQNHSQKEQELFLSMMKSCGICFVHREGDEEQGIETEYIAPDLLPEFAAVETEVAAQWNAEAECDEIVLHLPFLHPGVMRSLLSKIGNEAGMFATYWKDGACVFEKNTQSHARIEQELDSTENTWSGQIRIRTQGGRSEELIRLLGTWAAEAARSTGCEHESGSWDFKSRPVGKAKALPEPSAETTLKPEFAPAPRAQTTYAVSYAWRNKKPDGKPDEPLVDRLCAEAEKRGIHVLRDIHDMGLKDRISAFMTSLAHQDRVFVFLSDKYLNSENCMYELNEVWQYSQHNKEAFAERVRVFRFDDAKVFDRNYRLKIVDHWTTVFEEARPMIAKLAPTGALAPEEVESYNTLLSFAKHVSTILYFFKDSLLVTDMDAFLKEAFGEG